MSYAYYKFDNQMYCIQHNLLNIFSYCLLHFTNPILHNIAIRPLIHMGLSDNPTQNRPRKKYGRHLIIIKCNIKRKCNMDTSKLTTSQGVVVGEVAAWVY